MNKDLLEYSFLKGEFTQDCSTTDPSVAGRQWLREFELSSTWPTTWKLNLTYLNRAAVDNSAETNRSLVSS